MITKSLFIKGTTDYQGRLNFTVDIDYANLTDGNIWKVKAETVIFEIPKQRAQWHDERPISLSASFCYPPQSGDRTPTRPLLKLAIALVKGFEGEYVSLTSPGTEFISFQNPHSTLQLLLRDETDEEPLRNTKLIVNLIVAAES